MKISNIQTQNNQSFKSRIHIDEYRIHKLYGPRAASLISGANEANKILKKDYEDNVFLLEALFKKGYPNAPTLTLITQKTIKLLGIKLFEIPVRAKSQILPEIFPYRINLHKNPIEYVKNTILEATDKLKNS